MGNIVASGPSPGAWSETYGYDELYRLAHVQDGSGSVEFDRFADDATGNRVERQQGGPVVPYAYPLDSHRLASVAGSARSYDAMGNTLAGISPQASMEYGDHGRMVMHTQPGAESTTYGYNGRGERVIKAPVVPFCFSVCPGEIFVYDESGRLLGEYSTNGDPRQEHVWVDDTPVAVVNGSSNVEVLYVRSDHLNTPRALDGQGWRSTLAPELSRQCLRRVAGRKRSRPDRYGHHRAIQSALLGSVF